MFFHILCLYLFKCRFCKKLLLYKCNSDQLPTFFILSSLLGGFAVAFAVAPTQNEKRVSGQWSGDLWVENRAEIWSLFFQIFQNYSAIFVPVPFFEIVRIWSSFLSILLCSKYLQFNFDLLSIRLIPTVLLTAPITTPTLN